MTGRSGLAVDRMSIQALQSKAAVCLHQLREQLSLSLKEREQRLDLVQQVVNELAARAAQERLFGP